jgi:hypothetical protein
MANHRDIIERVLDFARRRDIEPSTVMRHATGDPRGFDRLKGKVEKIREVETWLNKNDVPHGTECASAPAPHQGEGKRSPTSGTAGAAR